MPLINGKRVEFDPYGIARSISEGQDVQGDWSDAESDYERRLRFEREQMMINEMLKRHFPRPTEYQRLWPQLLNEIG
jgi:hypothetical protein